MIPALLERAAPVRRRLSPLGHPIDEWAANLGFRAMLDAYIAHGGLMTCEGLSGRLRGVDSQPLSRIARWIVARDIVTLEWEGVRLVPRFQFSPRDWSVRAGVTRVLIELRDTFDDGELAAWFATPNSWLAFRTPVQCVGEDDDELLQAARADRFIARG